MRLKGKAKIRKGKAIAVSVAILAAAALVASIVISWMMPEKALDLSFIEGQALHWKSPGDAAGTEFTAGAGYQEVARNSRYRLEVDTEEPMFRVVDNVSGSIWYGGYHSDENPEDIIPRNARIMKNLLSVSYTGEDNSVSSLNSSADDVEADFRLIEDGFEILFHFVEPSIEVTLQIYLDDTGFYARVPEDRIQENGDYQVVSIDILPAFGSVMTGTDSYMVYPDGSGVIYDCKSSTGSESMYSNYIYAPPALTLTQETHEQEGYKNIPLPYYGTTDGTLGFAAYVVDGAEYSRISLSPGNAIFGLNRIYASLEYRNTLQVLNSQNQPMDVVSPERADADLCVKYLLLDQGEAHYSGMANALRDYLLEIGMLPDAGVEPGEIPLALDILMGVQKEGLLGSSYRDMTTYEQAAQMLDTLSEKGVGSLYTVLLGWQKEGYGVGPLSADSAGSSGALRALQEAFQEKQGRLFLQTDYVHAYDGGDFSTQRDIVYNFFDQAVTDEEESQFLLNPYRQYQQLGEDLAKYEKLGALGLAFDGLSSWLPADSSKNRALTATDAKNLYTAMAKLAKDSQLLTGVQTGNDYLLRYTDYIYNMHDGGSGLFQFSTEIPFYQMLVHGILPYSCSTPGNMSSDFTRTKLKWVEYGSMPYFLVTEQPASALEGSSASDIFSSCFSDWEQVIADTYEEFNSRLSAVYSQAMVSHEYVQEDVVCVTYEQGHRVYINYSDEDVQTAGVTIPRNDYLVINP